jgi:hypothetical protein
LGIGRIGQRPGARVVEEAGVAAARAAGVTV